MRVPPAPPAAPDGPTQLALGRRPLGVAFVEPLLCDAPTFFRLVANLVEPVRYPDPPLRHAGGDGRCQVAALHRGGDVGAVGEQDGFEHGSCFREVVGVGDHQGEVLALTASHCHVQAASRRRVGGEGEASFGGVALRAGFGGRIRELHVLADVVTRQGDRAVSVESGHGHITLLDGVGGGDGPAFTIPHRLTNRGAQAAFVATSRHHVTDHHPRIVDLGESRWVEFAGVESALLDVVVDRVDVFGACRDDRQRLTLAPTLQPQVADRVEMLGERPRPDPAVRCVCVECGRVPATQLE